MAKNEDGLTGLRLTRRYGESIALENENGEVSYVTVLKSPGRRVKLVIDAPKTVKIKRVELGNLYEDG